MHNPEKAALVYTSLLEHKSVMHEMKSARNLRAIVAKFGQALGFPLSLFGNLFPRFTMEEDYKAMASKKFRFDTPGEFDKSTFVALAGTEHREEQPSHLSILDPGLCIDKCDPLFDRACITFCPAGVYEKIGIDTRPANPSNCVHCKTCKENARLTISDGLYPKVMVVPNINKCNTFKIIFQKTSFDRRNNEAKITKYSSGVG
jgi:electron-transferring-flavoprotein dehydrogenase